MSDVRAFMCPFIPDNGDLFGHHPLHDGQGLYRPVHRRAGQIFSSGCWESQVKLPLHILIKQNLKYKTDKNK